MFPVRYFCNGLFAQRYFPKIGLSAVGTSATCRQLQLSQPGALRVQSSQPGALQLQATQPGATALQV